MTRSTPMTETVDDWMRGAIDGLMNQAGWRASAPVAEWIEHCRLDGFSGLIAQIPRNDSEKMVVPGESSLPLPQTGATLAKQDQQMPPPFG